MIKWLLLLFFYSTSLQAISPKKTISLTPQEYAQIIQRLEDLIESNKKLQKEVENYKQIQIAIPKLSLEPFNIFIDKSGRIFIRDMVSGDLEIGLLSYKVFVKINPKIVKANQEYGFGIRYKAASIWNYEYDLFGDLVNFQSIALVVEPFYYHAYNVNFLIGPRLYGPALGADLTEHFGILGGLGFLYDDRKTFFIGAAFDF